LLHDWVKNAQSVMGPEMDKLATAVHPWLSVMVTMMKADVLGTQMVSVVSLVDQAYVNGGFWSVPQGMALSGMHGMFGLQKSGTACMSALQCWDCKEGENNTIQAIEHSITRATVCIFSILFAVIF
jgi:hypothetical protein